MSPDDVFEELESTSAETRRQAVRSSDSLPPEPRRKVLVHGLGDADWRVRREAIEAVVQNVGADPTLIEELIDALVQGENVGLRNAALESLGRLGETATTSLTARLSKVDGGGRKFILEALGQSEATTAVDQIAPYIQDADPNIAAAAVDALARIGGQVAETHLRSLLASRDLYQRLAALDGLERAGARLAWADLEPAIADRFTRRAAVPLLGRSAHPDAVRALIEMLANASDHLASSVLLALEQLSQTVGVGEMRAQMSEQAIVVTRASLQSQNPETRRAAAGVALAAQDVSALASVLSIFVDGLSPMALVAFREWGREAVQPLLAAAETSVGAARALALELASELGDVREVLLDALDDPEPNVVAAALRGLKRLAIAADAERILARVRDGNDDVRAAAVDAIRQLSSRDEERISSLLSKSAVDAEGAAMASLLATIRGTRALPQLRAGCNSDSPEVRRACIAALGSLGDVSALPDVTLALSDEDPVVREAAAQSHGDLGGAPLTLVQLLGSEPSSDVRVAALRAIALNGEDEHIAPVAEMLNDSAASVVVESLRTLGRLDDPDLSARLPALLTHPDVEVVKQAIAELGRRPEDDVDARLDALLDHEAWDVRAAAADAIAARGGTSSRESLIPRLDTEADEVTRQAIEDALSRLGRDED